MEPLEHQGVLQMVQFQRALHPAPPARFMVFSPAQRRNGATTRECPGPAVRQIHLVIWKENAAWVG